MEFVETSVFTRQITALLSEDSYRRLQIELSLNPKAGRVIQGTGGLRKLRWGLPGRGKRGGIRTIYYHLDEVATIYLLVAYRKTEKDDLTMDEKRVLSALVRKLKP